MSMPIHWRLSFCAAWTVVPQPQKRVEDYIAFIGRGSDDAFEQRDWLLRWVAKALLSLRVQRRDVVPKVGNRRTGLFVKISL